MTQGQPTSAAATDADLVRWAEAETGLTVTGWDPISGGNRCQSWIVRAQPAGGGPTQKFYLRYQLPRPQTCEPYTVEREAPFYRFLQGTGVPAAPLVAMNPALPAIMLGHVEGIAEYRHLTDDVARGAIAMDFVEALATLHRLPLQDCGIPGFRKDATLNECARSELDIWGAMYAETGSADPLIDLGLAWLHDNLPSSDAQPVFVHGDAGPGNFLFHNGRMTALIDWEFAHQGDPMEDLAWFSMRCVMEPVPDFAACIHRYEALTGKLLDRRRFLYHRVLVSTRVLIIRHRNVTGELGNSIVSRALNRRLLVTALAAASNIALPAPVAIEQPATVRTPLYDSIVAELRDDIAFAVKDRKAVAAAKNVSKVVKYLRDCDRYGSAFEQNELDAMERLLGARPATAVGGHRALVDALQRGVLSFADVIGFFAQQTVTEARLAADASGRISRRSFPDIELDRA